MTEETLKLRKRVKALEGEAATLQDENRRLKTPPTQPSTPSPKADEQKKSWLEGGTFLD